MLHTIPNTQWDLPNMIYQFTIPNVPYPLQYTHTLSYWVCHVGYIRIGYIILGNPDLVYDIGPIILGNLLWFFQIILPGDSFDFHQMPAIPVSNTWPKRWKLEHKTLAMEFSREARPHRQLQRHSKIYKKRAIKRNLQSRTKTNENLQKPIETCKHLEKLTKTYRNLWGPPGTQNLLFFLIFQCFCSNFDLAS